MSQDAVFVVVEDALTWAEHELVRIGDEQLVLRMREGPQRAMHAKLDAKVEHLSGRRAFWSSNHLDPDADLAVEVFIFAPEDASQIAWSVVAA